MFTRPRVHKTALAGKAAVKKQVRVSFRSARSFFSRGLVSSISVAPWRRRTIGRTNTNRTSVHSPHKN